MPQIQSPSELEVTIDRRRNHRRSAEEISAEITAEIAAGKLKKSSAAIKKQIVAEAAPGKVFNEPRRRKERRRQIDPTTCERDYNADEIDFMQAFDAYKRSSGRMFPTCSEILEVVRSLGYTKLSDEERQLLASLEEVEAELVNI